MATVDLVCWSCGGAVTGVPLPLGRREECPACVASLRACRGCEFFDATASGSCREPMADAVSDREQANSCDYFRVDRREGESQDQGEAAKARRKLEGLFGSGGAAQPGGELSREVESLREQGESEAERARKKLADLFGGEKK